LSSSIGVVSVRTSLSTKLGSHGAVRVGVSLQQSRRRLIHVASDPAGCIGITRWGDNNTTGVEDVESVVTSTELRAVTGTRRVAGRERKDLSSLPDVSTITLDTALSTSEPVSKLLATFGTPLLSHGRVGEREVGETVTVAGFGETTDLTVRKSGSVVASNHSRQVECLEVTSATTGLGRVTTTSAGTPSSRHLTSGGFGNTASASYQHQKTLFVS
jgi:hypothetical protein